MWYRSLYWRIGFGFVALLAALLLVQAVLFLVITGQAENWLPLRSPSRTVALVASDLSGQFSQNRNLDLDEYVRRHYGNVYQPFVVVMTDGHVVPNRMGRPPMGLVRAARERLGVAMRFPGEGPGRMFPDGSARPRGERPSTPSGSGSTGGGRAPVEPRMPPERGTAEDQRPDARGGPGAMGPRAGRSGPPPNPLAESSPIVVGGETIGLVVAVTGGPPLLFLLGQFGPTLAVVGAGLLVAGAAVGSLVIFGPARRRLQKLEEAAHALGTGRTSVRAEEHGDDEVTALARAFNRMAVALETSDAARRRLLADVSHELRTPLTAIRGYVETLGMPEVELDDETRRRYLHIVGDETQKLETIVGDLLELARLEGGGGALAPQRVTLERLFARIADRHHRVLEEKGISLETRVDSRAAEVWGDPGRLEQALQNLAANAVRHTPEGGRVTFLAEPAGTRVRIVVRDSGPGIPPEHLPHIFDRFYKVDVARASNEAAAGSGLGLSIVKAIVERHGGSLSASNGAEGGAVFELLLPAGAEQPRSDERA